MNTDPLRASSAPTTRPTRLDIFGVAMTFKSALSYWRTRAIADQRGQLVQAEFARGNIFAEADFLHRAGFRVAAVLTARVAIESYLRRLSIVIPEWRRASRAKGMYGISSHAYFLQRSKTITPELCRQLCRLGSKLSATAHGRRMSPQTSQKIMREVREVREKLNDVMMHALSLT